MSVQLYLGDCLEVMKSMPDKSVDTCITDPPYGLGFMGKQWDTFDKAQFGIAGNEGENDLKVKKNFKILPRYANGGDLYNFTLEWASEVYRVLKPGALLLAFGGTRTYHRLVCAIEDAGFEIRDCIAWVYGSGFPKSHDISKAIDKRAGAEREVVGKYQYPDGHERNLENCIVRNATSINMRNDNPVRMDITAPSTPEAQLWDGWGTALKPAHEPIVVAMKPIDGTYAENALKWGVAGYWIDGGRVGTEEHIVHGKEAGKFQPNGGETIKDYHEVKGRFPANLIHDGSDEVTALFPNDASRFFYCAKASRSERNAGLEGMEEVGTIAKFKTKEKRCPVCGCRSKNAGENELSCGHNVYEWVEPAGGEHHKGINRNHHPTVKPISLMRYLVRITKTPTGGVVFDPFLGSGTTGCACALEGRDFIGIEIDPTYFAIAERRIAEAQMQLRLELTAHSDIERQDDKWIPEVQE